MILKNIISKEWNIFIYWMNNFYSLFYLLTVLFSFVGFNLNQRAYYSWGYLIINGLYVFFNAINRRNKVKEWNRRGHFWVAVWIVFVFLMLIATIFTSFQIPAEAFVLLFVVVTTYGISRWEKHIFLKESD